MCVDVVQLTQIGDELHKAYSSLKTAIDTHAVMYDYYDVTESQLIESNKDVRIQIEQFNKTIKELQQIVR